MILVTGATGTVGREVVRLLTEANAKVRALTRDPSKARFASSVEVVRGDFDDVASLEAATKGVEKVFLLAIGPNLAEAEGRVLAAAKKNGAKHAVKISTLGAPAKRVSIARWHRASEEQLEASGLQWTHLRPSGFMSNALSWAGSIKKAGAVFGAVGDVKAPPIHPTDIAACAVVALTQSGHENQAYELTGGEALSMHEQTEILGKAVGSPIRYVNLPDEKLRESMIAAGRPPAIADGVIELQKAVRDGGGTQVSPAVEKLLGRAPLKWEKWCQDNAGAFR